MLKIGMPILFEYDSLEDNIKLAKELGLDFIELNLNFSYCRKALENGSAKQLLSENNLEATLHFYDEGDFASYPEVVDAYLTLLDRYATLGEGFVKLINVHLQRGPVVTISGIKNYIYKKEYNDMKERYLASYHKADDICNKHGIKMVIEDTDEIQPFMEAFYYDLYSEGFKFNYDIGHDNLANDVVLKLLDKLPLKFDEFHIHDANRKQCHLALGTGNVDLKFFKEMAIKNQAYALLEVKDSKDLRISVPYFRAL